MSFDIFLAIDAERDIIDIYEYIYFNDTPEKIYYVYSKLKEVINNLSTNPERGHPPKEFEKIGIKEYLEIYFKPYRIIFQIVNKRIQVHCVLDGRRDLEELLHKRLLQ
jgi:toxin ParE1/3/4